MIPLSKMEGLDELKRRVVARKWQPNIIRTNLGHETVLRNGRIVLKEGI